MSSPSDVETLIPQVELLETDGEPLESAWHRSAMNLLIDAVTYHNRHRQDFYAGGNMFIYFSEEQARNRDFRGPDFYFVNGGVSRAPQRRYWVVWREGGRYPDVIIELLSESTREVDRTTKKDIYERIFRTSEYYCYDPDTHQLEGWRLAGGQYEPIAPNDRGWLWSKQLQLWLGLWEGSYLGDRAVWLRFYDANGEVVPTEAEAAQLEAEVERERAEEVLRLAEGAHRRIEALEAEVARLKAQLAGQGGAPPAAS